MITFAPLIGRDREIGRLNEVIAAARARQGGALVLHGEAGIGKSALLEQAQHVANGLLILRAGGTQFEADLPYAALHQLCLPLLGGLGRLPGPYAGAIRGAFGLTDEATDPLRTGSAVLSLLATAAQEQPVLCVVDDAHWLDNASLRALTFLAARIGRERIALLIASRTPTDLEALPGLAVTGLGHREARALLTSRRHLPLDEQVGNRFLAEARGNPLALLELPRLGSYQPTDDISPPSRVERDFQSRLAGRSADARLLLTLASADPTGDPGLLWPAARLAGLDLDTAAADAVRTGLVEFSTRVRFCHPLARSAVYRGADAAERRTVHALLARVTDAGAEPDRRAWHRGQSCAGPDRAVAAELEACAQRAVTRGGIAACAAFLERSAALTADPALRNARTLRAVHAHLDAGAADAAADLLTTLDQQLLDERGRAQVDQLRGRVALLHPDSDEEAADHLLQAARRLAGTDPVRSRAYLTDALELSLAAGRGKGLLERVLATAGPAPVPDVIDGLRLLAEDHLAAVPLLRELLSDEAGPLRTERPALAVMVAAELWDPDRHHAVVNQVASAATATGSPPAMRLSLALTASHAAFTGDLRTAIAATAEERALAEASGGEPILFHQLHLAALQGRRDKNLFGYAESAAERSGHRIANLHWADAFLSNAHADYPAALAAAQRVVDLDDVFFTGFALPELVEAAVRTGQTAVASMALRPLGERARASGTITALGIAACARGLVTGDERHYRQAVELLAESPLVPYRARAHLVFGEWLRREGRRRDCRHHLRYAHTLFAESGMTGYEQRAATELRATGAVVRSRSAHATHELTMRETAVARLVATGATSNDVARQLFLSPRTVDAHLRSIFRKLGITSRRQLRELLDLRPAIQRE